AGRLDRYGRGAGHRGAAPLRAGLGDRPSTEQAPQPPPRGREPPSPAVGGEMLVVLRGRPVTAPQPADRDERPPDRVAVPDHRWAAPGPVRPRGRGGRVAGAAADPGALEQGDVERAPR